MTKKYIDADDVMSILFHLYDIICGNDGRTKVVKAYRTIENLPAADVQEVRHGHSEQDVVKVVRCKNCRYLKYNRNFITGRYCSLRNVNGGKYCEDNDFCSYGARMDGELNETK